MSSLVTRLVLCSFVASVAIAAVPAAQSTAPTYTLASTVPLGLQGYADLDVDLSSDRAFLSVREGMRVLDARTGRITAPLTSVETSGSIAVAPSINRVFAEIDDDYVGFIDAGTYVIDHLVRVEFPGRLMYEPATEELYVFSPRRAEVEVYDGRSGVRKATVELPGWGGDAVLKTPGRIYVRSLPRTELYVIDTNERVVSPFTLPRSVRNQPNRFAIAANASGETVFVADDYEIVALDAATARELGRTRTPGGAYLFYDDEADVLLARVREADYPLLRQVVYRFDGAEFERVATQDLPREGGGVSFATSRGYISAYVTTLPALADRGLVAPTKQYLTVWTRDRVTR